MKISNLMSTAAIAALMASAAQADSNAAYLDQAGDRNTASIDQSAASSSAVGSSASKAATQSGDDNALSIEQIGNRNTVAAGGTGNDVARQSNNDNAATILQDGEDNDIRQLRQTGVRDFQDTTTDDVNTATATQTGNGNSIQNLQQRYEIAVGTAANSLVLSQTGNDNLVKQAFQYGAGNSLNAAFDGDRNGATPLSGVSLLPAPPGVPSSAAGRHSSYLIQDGLDNDIKLDVDANDTAFGFYQLGEGNSVNTVAITGDFNSMGVRQEGNENTVNQTSITSVMNVIGVLQQGDENRYQMTQLGGDGNIVDVDQFENNNEVGLRIGNGSDDNEVTVLQTGLPSAGKNRFSVRIRNESDRNDIDVTQTDKGLGTVDVRGSDNDIDVVQDGTNFADVKVGNQTVPSDNNTLNVGQTGGAGGRNEVFVDLFGSDNNATGFSGPTTAAAASAASLGQGDLFQSGVGNSMTLEIGTSTLGSDGNVFAMRQDGDFNVIEGAIAGTANEAVVVQVGNANTTGFTQNGATNMATVLQ